MSQCNEAHNSCKGNLSSSTDATNHMGSVKVKTSHGLDARIDGAH